jgi:hypothetical protein
LFSPPPQLVSNVSRASSKSGVSGLIGLGLKDGLFPQLGWVGVVAEE